MVNILLACSLLALASAREHAEVMGQMQTRLPKVDESPMTSLAEEDHSIDMPFYQCKAAECPHDMPHRYPGSNRCFAKVWGKKACTVDPKNDPKTPQCNCVPFSPCRGHQECPPDMPHRYPGNNRCFEKVWGKKACNVDPKNDPLPFQRHDVQCNCASKSKPPPKSKPPAFPCLLDKECPHDMPHRYPGTNRCFERVWGKKACNVDPKNDPIPHHRNDVQCDCTPFYQCKAAECPHDMPHRYPGTNRCFKTVWGKKACNVDPKNDPIPHHRNDVQCNCVPFSPCRGHQQCPHDMPHRYPGNNRCFEKVWGKKACNVDPKNDPLPFQRHDVQCNCAPPHKPRPQNWAVRLTEEAEVVGETEAAEEAEGVEEAEAVGEADGEA